MNFIVFVGLCCFHLFICGTYETMQSVRMKRWKAHRRHAILNLFMYRNCAKQNPRIKLIKSCDDGVNLWKTITPARVVSTFAILVFGKTNFAKIPRRKEVVEIEKLKFLKIRRNCKKYLLKHVNLCKIDFSSVGWLF
jgi:hypothetical protein